MPLVLFKTGRYICSSNRKSDYLMCTSLSAGLAGYSLGTLTADAEFLDQSQILVTALGSNVFKQALALADQLQQTAAGHEVVFILLHVIGQLGDPGCHYTHLHRRRTAVFVMGF
jgi:hypothetical protein